MKPHIVNVPKEITWDILRCCILWYEGVDPVTYGFDKELSRIGKNLSDALFERVEKLIPQFLRQGKIVHHYDKEMGKVLIFKEDKNGRY